MVLEAEHLNALAMSYVSTLGTVAGGFLIMFFPRLRFQELGWLAGLAAGLMLSMVFFELIPEALESISFNATNACFFAGILFFATVIRLVPEQNLEGLVTKPKTATGKGEKKMSKEYRKILMSGLVTALGLTLHNFPEGLAIFLAAKKSTKLGLTLTTAMTLHNLPEGVAVALPIYFATKSRWQALKITALSGLAEPLAVVFAALFFPSSISKGVVDAMLAGVAGIMTFLVFYELLPHAVKHCGPERAAASLFVGMGIMSLLLSAADEIIVLSSSEEERH
ncbi:ZIP zinc transporter [Chloropicon primus]|uniref:ZIP zinc transporter n=2 Tax=Chloropicon primus TaxID=1764295 RepID=A0A5B8MQP4_9CHLO|nr:ZIP zinc transporter [Chloropicon primus]UPR01155.1 ZIP zinc transporter [Chloropicon primus]|eukprot:QDZ21935.1 ZIP zinc transporter [Chloropicon primus]